MDNTIGVNDRHLHYLQSGALDLAASLYDDFFNTVEAKLLDLADHARNNEQQWNIFSLARDVKNQKPALVKRYNEYLLEGFVQFKLGKLGGRVRSSEQDELSTSLSLVADEELERSIAVTSLARRAETRNMEQLFALNHRLAMLNGGKKIADDGNPIGPYQYADALGEMLDPLNLDNSKLTLFCRVFEQVLSPKLSEFYEKANQYFIDQGILPNLRYSVSKSDSTSAQTQEPVQSEPIAQATELQQPAGGAAAVPAANNQVNTSSQAGATASSSSAAQTVSTAPVAPVSNTQSVPSPIYQQQLMNTINELKGTAQAVDEATFASDEERMAAQLQAAHDFVSAAFMKPKEVASVVQNVQQETVSIETFDCDVVKPMTAEQYQMVAQRIHDEISEDQSIGDKEIKAIDLVGMIFEYMLSDEQLPDSVKAVLSYLHTPFLKIAIVDPDFFEQPDHPARALLNILAEAGHKWVNSDGASQFKIFPKIKAVVRQILLDSECSLDMLRELVQEMTEFNSKVSRKIEMLEQRAKAKAEGEEKIRLVKRRVYSEIKHRMDDKAVPAAVVVLLLHPWADYMIFTLLRHGEESEAWNNALTMVDNILWSIESKDDEADVVRQQRLLNRLQVEIKHAIDEISFDSNKANKLIKILHDLQLKAINHQEIISANAEEQKKIEDAVHLDEYVIAEEEKASNEEKAMLDKLQHVEFGSWLESGDHKNRMKIAWYNPKTEHYMLVDGSGQNVSMRSALSIVRDLLNDDVKIVETSKRPFIERALENIVRKLKAPLSAQVA